MKLYHCWYSKSQDDARGHVFYEIDGKEKKITLADDDFEKAKEHCAADSIYVGIGKFIRTTPKSEEYNKNITTEIDSLVYTGSNAQKVEALDRLIDKLKDTYSSN